MEMDALVTTHPRLFHMAEADAWPSIKRHGLLSTEALLELYGVTGPRRAALLERRRGSSVQLNHPEHGRAVVRDNLPLNEAKLEACLTDMSVPDFLRMINRHVYFWPSAERLDRLFKADAYARRKHLILEIGTASLVAEHGPALRLSPINSGATLFKAQPRGSQTLLPVAEYDFEHWRKKRTRTTAVAEVCVERAVPEVTRHTVRVYVRHQDGTREPLEV